MIRPRHRYALPHPLFFFTGILLLSISGTQSAHAFPWLFQVDPAQSELTLGGGTVIEADTGVSTTISVATTGQAGGMILPSGSISDGKTTFVQGNLLVDLGRD